MKTRIILFALFVGITNVVYSQRELKQSDYIDATFAIGSNAGTLSFSYLHNWRIGKQQKFSVGVGVRASGFLGANVYYVTAPAKLTSGSTGPLVLFKENIVQNIDSLLVKSPQVNALNVMVNIDYRLTPRFTVGFNIDAIGFSFGSNKNGNYINGVEGNNTEAKPTSFNILLVSDNDRGTLNSELFLKYLLTDKWFVKGGGQFLFTEYTTKTKVQKLPEENDRFRNKALLFCIGITYKL